MSNEDLPTMETILAERQIDSLAQVIGVLLAVAGISMRLPVWC